MSIVSSVRNVALCGVVLLGSAVGCQQRRGPEPVSEEPLTIDPAMQLRNWPRTSAQYVNGGVIAGPTGFFYQPREDEPTIQTMIAEPLMFPVQTALLPISLIVTPPWTPVLYRGAVFEPHHNLQTPLETIPY